MLAVQSPGHPNFKLSWLNPLQYMALREQIPLLCLLKEVVENNIDTTFKPATIHCKAFEDNSGALEMVKLPKI